jgi:hypothetical protein
VCVSLEEWAAGILIPNISTVLSNAMTDSKTKTGFELAKKPEAFKITEEDYRMTIDEDKIGLTNHTYDTTPDQNKNKPKEELILNISTTIKNLLTKANAKQKKTKKIKEGEPDDNDIAHKDASSLLALVNTFNEGNQFNQLDYMHNHMTQKIDERQKNLEIANYDDSSSN